MSKSNGNSGKGGSSRPQSSHKGTGGNWPSQNTGKPSGKSRGNAVPGKGK